VEVLASIRFTTPCLGHIRGKDSNRMLRDADGNIIFLQTWWRAGLGFAAQSLCRYQKEVPDIQTDPVVEGELGTYRRYYAPDKYTDHEAFDAGSIIQVRFMLPRKIDFEGFKALLELSGKYVGISPCGYRQDFGRFTVVNVDVLRTRGDLGGREKKGTD
jgi:hypothetical protein